LKSPKNVALTARVSASSVHKDYSLNAAVDGVVGGYPGNTQHEWASNGEGDSAMIRLTWDSPQKINRIWLFDRPNDLDQITSGMILFDDGTTIKTGALPDDAKKGLEISFEPKSVKWLLFIVNTVKPKSPNIGLAEIAVFSAD
jgi:hypothetical protein